MSNHKIDQLFLKLIENGGSDLHLKEGFVPKIRLNGELHPLDNEEVLTEQHLTDLMCEIASEDYWERFVKTGDLDFAYELPETARFRVNYLRDFKGIGAICRIIPSKIKSLTDLEMPKILENFAELNSGLVLITGPTGSGKSTTLAAIIDHINSSQQKKIITIEEPVEFIHPLKKSIISHREVGMDTESFASGLKGAIKSDPNIILVGEMRDRETIELALVAAQMGSLVFGTLHTNSAAKTIDRIVDVFPTNKKNQVRTNLASSLKGVVSQQLCKSADGSRRYCAYEILLACAGLAPIIQSGETTKLTSEIQLNRQNGMLLMDDRLQELVSENKISKETAYLKAINKSLFS